jgi:hypothetical protein
MEKNVDFSLKSKGRVIYAKKAYKDIDNIVYSLLMEWSRKDAQ